MERCNECPAWYEAVCEGGGCIRENQVTEKYCPECGRRLDWEPMTPTFQFFEIWKKDLTDRGINHQTGHLLSCTYYRTPGSPSQEKK